MIVRFPTWSHTNLVLLNDQKHYDGGSGANNNDINNDNVDIDNNNDYYDDHTLMALSITTVAVVSIMMAETLGPPAWAKNIGTNWAR